MIIKEHSPGYYVISGNLTFSTITNKTLIALNPAKNATISLNFKQIKTCDSAGLALIIAWLKSAHKRNLRLYLQNLPDSLLSLAKLGGIEAMIINASSP